MTSSNKTGNTKRKTSCKTNIDLKTINKYQKRLHTKYNTTVCLFVFKIFVIEQEISISGQKMVIPTQESQSNPTNLSGKSFEMVNTSVKANKNDGDVFYETAAAQGISGLFVALAILITVHQARKLCIFNKSSY